ncbi:hypothetical protein GCM10029964_014130 [Kibdelosporangium lantanae]
MNGRSPFSDISVSCFTRSTTTAAVVADFTSCFTAAPTFGTSADIFPPGTAAVSDGGVDGATVLVAADFPDVPGMISNSFADGVVLCAEHPDSPRTRSTIPQIALFMPG